VSTKVDQRLESSDGEQEVAEELARVRGELSGVEAELRAAGAQLIALGAETEAVKHSLVVGSGAWRSFIFTVLLGAVLGFGGIHVLYRFVDPAPTPSRSYRSGYEHPTGMPLQPPR
jgi:hypothetical protein